MERLIEAEKVREVEPDTVGYCPNCGKALTAIKCKLVCEHPECGVYIVMACVD